MHPKGLTLHHNNECILAEDDFLFSVGVKLKRVKNGDVVFEKIYNDQILPIFKDSENNIWISEQFNGLYMYADGNLNADPIAYLSNYTVSRVLQDMEGNYWFSTTENGVYFVPSIQFFEYNKTRLGIGSDIILTLELFGDELFLTTDNKGVYSFFLKDTEIIKNRNFTYPQRALS